jgi:hypothetical protein
MCAGAQALETSRMIADFAEVRANLPAPEFATADARRENAANAVREAARAICR